MAITLFGSPVADAPGAVDGVVSASPLAAFSGSFVHAPRRIAIEDKQASNNLYGDLFMGVSNTGKAQSKPLRYIKARVHANGNEEIFVSPRPIMRAPG